MKTTTEVWKDYRDQAMKDLEYDKEWWEQLATTLKKTFDNIKEIEV